MRLGGDFVFREVVQQGWEECVLSGGGGIHTDTIDGYFSIFKRGKKGIYQQCSKKHLHRHLAEFDLRYSDRPALGCEDQERATRAVVGGVGKRLTYRWPDGKPA
jgi:hypothetical protein